METAASSSGKKQPKAVRLNLDAPANVQKGRALVGRLETDKNLNKGVVISMIKKGWGLDKGMEIHEIFWVPRSHRDPFWVSVKYERLQHFCYDCGRIGHDSRSCKFQLEEADEEVTEQRFGSSLGTPHVKTIDEALMVLDKSWDETELGDNSAIPLPRGTEWVNRPDFAEDTVMVANDSVPKITEIPLITAPMILIPQSAVPTVQQPLLTSHVMHDSEDIGVTNENDNDGVSLGIFGVANGQNLNEVNEALMVANQSEPNVMEIPQSVASMVQHPLLSPHFMQESDAMGVTNDNGNDRENLE
ncbi:hypothetical protein K1719_028098 [Acacia pycnantha]|nr:hypothetical protein K1719_028098 [Acacia pycnantha]